MISKGGKMIPGTVHIDVTFTFDNDIDKICVEIRYGIGLNQIIISDGFFEDVILFIDDPAKLRQALDMPAQ